MHCRLVTFHLEMQTGKNYSHSKWLSVAIVVVSKQYGDYRSNELTFFLFTSN